MNKAPLFILEEHHEAFLAWHYAVAKGWMPAEGCVLVHIDEHADLDLPALDTPVPRTGTGPEELITFTYSGLSVASFLLPAVYLGWFDRIYWLRTRHDDAASGQILCITSDEDGRRLRPSPTLSLKEALDERRRCFRLEPVGPADSVDLSGKPVVLDIDLDYFSCDNKAGEGWDVEITRSAYESIQADRYHPLRLAAGNRVKVREAGGSYYMYSNQGALAEAGLKTDEGTIRARVDGVLEFLRRSAARPSVIDVSRSRISGYTPADQCAFIESRLLEGLSSLYDCDPVSLDRLLDAQSWR